MARVCKVTGKRPMTGNNVSHANNKTDEPGVAELIIRKARNGSVGMVKTRWHAEHTSFEDL